MKKTIVSWSIEVEWDDGSIEHFSDVPDDVAMSVDEYLGDVEQDRTEELESGEDE